MRRADRLFRLVQLLRNRRMVTADLLAQELRVSVRTIYRDIKHLVASGVPVRGEAGVGYRLDRGFELPPMAFNPDELEALVLGARMVEAWGDEELALAARAALEKIRAVVPTGLAPVLADAALFAATFPVQRARATHLGPLRHALAQRRKVHFGYTNAKHQSSHRVVWPLGLYFWGQSWSLAAWCELRQDYRSFRPDRMQDLQVLDTSWSEQTASLAGFRQAMAAAEAERARCTPTAEVVSAPPQGAPPTD